MSFFSSIQFDCTYCVYEPQRKKKKGSLYWRVCKSEILLHLLFIPRTQGAVFNADNDSVRVSIIMKGRETAEAYCEVLNHVSSIIVHPSQPKKQQLVVLSKKVAISVSDLVKQAEQLKG